MTIPSYSNYTDTNAQWIGLLPQHWKLSRAKYAFQIQGGSTPKSAIESYWEGGVIWVTPTDLSNRLSKFISDSKRKITNAGLQSCGATLVPAGSLILSTRAPIGSLGIASTQLCTNQGCKALTPGKSVNETFFEYYLRVSTEQLNVLGKGTTFIELSADELGSFSIPLPPLEEQKSIATFLDRETARIDTLIEKQQRLIALLKEKRQAVISHAVTKGLDPTVLMKDSGVEWLGEVPGHWDIAPMKHLSFLQSGIAKGKEVPSEEAVRVPYIRVANVQDGYLDLNDIAEIDVRHTDLSRYLLQVGDVLMNEGGDFDKLGRGAIWHGQISPCIHQNHVFAIRPTKVEPNWLTIATQAAYAKFYFILVSKQSTNLASISSSNLKEVPIVVPPEPERLVILDFIAMKTDKIDELIEKSAHAVFLLQERRTALISAAVTGKIDVRNHPSAKDAA